MFCLDRLAGVAAFVSCEGSRARLGSKAFATGTRLVLGGRGARKRVRFPRGTHGGMRLLVSMREPKDEHERKALADVQKHGWHVLKVMEDNEGPAFAYTVGLYHSFGHPELIVVGLPSDVGHAVLNVAGESIRRGDRYSAGSQSEEFLEDRVCAFRTMPESQYRHYLGWNLWFHDGAAFPALQMVWTDREGRWPWETTVDPAVRERQPAIEDQGHPPWAPGAGG